jgi:hypothetical protein
MVRRGEITDRAWEQIEPLLPREGGKRGGQWPAHPRGIRLGPNGSGRARGPTAPRSLCVALRSRGCIRIGSPGCGCTWSRCKRVVPAPMRAFRKAWPGGKTA